MLRREQDREILLFPVQLTASRIGNLKRLILTLVIYDDHTYTSWSGETYKIFVHTGFPPKIEIDESWKAENERKGYSKALQYLVSYCPI